MTSGRQRPWAPPTRRRAHVSGWIGATVLALVVAASALAPLIAPRDPLAVDLRARLSPPSASEPLGTDELGRSTLARVLYGGRVSLLTALAAAAAAAVAGTLLGALAGAAGGLSDAVLMRVVDAALVCPPILLALAIVGAIGPGLVPAAVALAAVEAPVFARLTRGAMVVAREAPAVEAAIALGAGRWRVAVRHVLPAALGLVVVQAASSTAFAVAALAGLSFLGLGVQPPTPDWGEMLARSRTTAVTAPWLVAAPAAALVLTVLACHLLGDALHDALVRRGRRSG